MCVYRLRLVGANQEHKALHQHWIESSAKKLRNLGHPQGMHFAFCRERLARAEEENKALRLELSALEPEFFEEIEDLKWDHHQLQQRAAQYEGLIAGLAAELGRAPPRPLGVGFVERTAGRL